MSKKDLALLAGAVAIIGGLTAAATSKKLKEVHALAVIVGAILGYYGYN